MFQTTFTQHSASGIVDLSHEVVAHCKWNRSRRIRLVSASDRHYYTGAGPGKRVVTRLRELAPRSQRESEGGIHATYRDHSLAQPCIGP